MDGSMLAYCAGFFDGEGHICIAKAKSRTNRNGKIYEYDRYCLKVSAAQNVREPLDAFVSVFGGRVYRSTGRTSYGSGVYVRWNWHASTDEASKFLIAVRPFLKVKGKEADIAIAFQQTMDAKRKLLPQEVIEFREQCFWQIRRLRDGRQFSAGLSDKANEDRERMQARARRALETRGPMTLSESHKASIAKAHCTLSERQARLARDLKESGLSYAAIGERLGVSKTVAWNACKGNGWYANA